MDNFTDLKPTPSYDVICFSHLRWDFVFQRPQHLMNRFAKQQRVFIIEEPVFQDHEAHLKITKQSKNLYVAVPNIPHGLAGDELNNALSLLISELIEVHEIKEHLSWYYTPMMLAWSEHLEPIAVVYDCMDELSAFKNAPPELHQWEVELLQRADVVFTGGHSLYEAKREQHTDIYPFPSSIDKDHFARARVIEVEIEDQQDIPHPRIGYVGVIDERMDLDLLAEIARQQPSWNFVMIGPVVKIREDDLPRLSNIHYLGQKEYGWLPNYLAGWDVAMMPFALNESTRYISPTKTPEFLAAGLPVVSTPIADVVSPYGDEKLVYIAENADEFITAIQNAMDEDTDLKRMRADEFIAGMSWDKTFEMMSRLINNKLAVESKAIPAAA